MTRNGFGPAQRPRLVIMTAFGVAALAAVTFAVAYVLGAGTQVLGTAFAVAFGGLAVGLTIWARHLSSEGGYVEEHEGFSSAVDDRDRTVQEMTAIAHPARRGLLGMLALGVLTIGAAALFPLRSLRQPHGDHVLQQLRHTAWQGGGLALVDTNGRPVRLIDVQEDSFITVFPEGHHDAGDVPTFVVRIDPSRFISPPPAQHIDGVVAFSLLCTHASCPVSLYEQGTGHMLCPCHQSVFDLLKGGRAIAGPAARSLPGLPIAVGDDGVLYATGDFTAPPGAGFWSLPT